MPAYGIANYTIHNPEIFEKYPPAAVPTIQQYGGKVLVADFDAQAKGSPHQVSVVIEFSSVEAAQRWYESPEYSAIKHYREESTEGWVAIVPGYVIPAA